MAAKPMTKSKIVAAVAEKVGITKKQAALVLETLAHLAHKEAKLGFTCGDNAAHKHTAWDLLQLGLDRFCDAQLLKHVDQIGAAWTGRVADRLSCQQRFLQ